MLLLLQLTLNKIYKRKINENIYLNLFYFILANQHTIFQLSSPNVREFDTN